MAATFGENTPIAERVKRVAYALNDETRYTCCTLPAPRQQTAQFDQSNRRNWSAATVDATMMMMAAAVLPDMDAPRLQVPDSHRTGRDPEFDFPAESYGTGYLLALLVCPWPIQGWYRLRMLLSALFRFRNGECLRSAAAVF